MTSIWKPRVKNDSKTRRSWLLATCLLFTQVNAQASGQVPDAATTVVVSEAQVLRDFILCEGPVWGSVGNDTLLRKMAEPEQLAYSKAFTPLMEKLEKQNNGQFGSANSAHWLASPYALGPVLFSDVMPIATMGFAGVISYSPTATLTAMQGLMKQLGIKLVATAPKVAQPATFAQWQAVRLSGETATVYDVGQGNILGMESSRGGALIGKGYSLVCRTRATTEEEDQGRGLIGLEEAKRVLKAGEPPAGDWFETVLQRGTPNAKLSLAHHHPLALAQVQKLLDLRDESVLAAIIRNRGIILTADQLQGLADTPPHRLTDKLIDRYHAQFTELSRQRLSRNPRWKSSLLLLNGGDEGALELRRIYQSGDQPAVDFALDKVRLFEHSPAKLSLVDVILELGSTGDRRRLSMSSGIMLTPAQVRLLLQDQDEEVLSGVLRRKDLPMPEDLLSQGLSRSSNPRVLRLYRERLDHRTP